MTVCGTLVIPPDTAAGLNAMDPDPWRAAAQAAIDAGYGESTEVLGQRLNPHWRPPVPPAMID